MKFKFCLNLFYLSFLLGLTISETSASQEPKGLAYARHIIYFYPDKSPKEHSRQHFKQFDTVKKLPKSVTTTTLRFQLIDDVSKNYPVPDLQYLSYFGRGLSRAQAEQIQTAKQGLIIDAAYPRSDAHSAIKALSIALYKYAADNEALIWDSETRELFGLPRWQNKRLKSWHNNIPDISDHTVIHAYKNDHGVRAISLGMAKFGLPDIVINDFSWSINRPMGNVINLLAQALVEGQSFSPNKEFQLSPQTLLDTPIKREIIAELKDNAKDSVKLKFAAAKREEGDPNNFLLEIRFDHIDGNSLSEKQEQLISQLFGWEDEVSYVKHNQKIEAASQEARKQLDGLRQAFQQGLAPGEYIQLKAPFKTPDGGNEWMWVEVLSWQGQQISGLLRNEPRHIPSLKAGAEVHIQQDDVFDYIHRQADGSYTGNKTGELIRQFQQR